MFIDISNERNINWEEIISFQGLVTIQVFEVPSNIFFDELNNKLLIKQNICLRLIGEDIWTDLGFLSKLKRLQRLEVDDYFIQNIDGITHLDELKAFSISGTKKKLSLTAISHFSCLEDIRVGGNKKDLGFILKLKKLKSLSLIGTSFEFTDQMSINIESLTILRSKVKGLESLNSQKKLTELSLSFLQKVNNLDLIREVKSLKKLTINTVKVSHLPNFTKLDSLKGIYLENIGKVNNLDIIASASNLEEFVFYNAKEYEASDFLFLNDMKVLQKVIIDLNSEKKMNELNSFLKIKK